eukprot:SAG31_NODE_27900_length_418_cov_1.291536_1_plen_32_part_10
MSPMLPNVGSAVYIAVCILVIFVGRVASLGCL